MVRYFLRFNNSIALIAFLFLPLILLPFVSHAAEEGGSLDAVPFGEIQKWDSSGKDIGVIWEDPRDIFRVRATFETSAAAPLPQSPTLQYWQSQWPERRIPRDQPSGAGSSGWLDIGDWFQGQWKTADAKMTLENNTVTFTFNPLNATEFPDLKDFPAEYRTTMKLRIAAAQPLPPVKSLEAFTDSTLKSLDVEILWGGIAEEAQTWDGHLEVFNGLANSISPATAESEVAIQADQSWTSTVQNGIDGVHASILYAVPQGFNSFDETIVTVRARQDTFSFAPSDLLKWGHIFIPDYGVLIKKTGDAITYEEAEKAWKESKEKDLYTRVESMPEQTFTQAWNDTPAKDPHYIPLSFEGGRQHFRLDEHGNAACIKNWINRIPGKDTAKCLWDGEEIRYNFGLPESRLASRTLVDGYLPIVVSKWDDNGINYTQTAYVIPLNGVPKAGGRIWADDTLVLMIRIEVEKPTVSNASAHLEVSSQHGGNMESLIVKNNSVFVSGTDPLRLRMQVTPKLVTFDGSFKEKQGRLEYGNTNAQQFYDRFDFAIPYITLTEEKDIQRLRSLDFDRSQEEINQYWQKRLDESTRIVTPEPMINDFYNADLAHLLINTEREVGVSDCYMAKVGTFSYGVYSNESCMMISDLDRRGFNKRAEQAINTWFKYQGSVGLPGDYSVTDGQFYGAGGYESGGYNQHHGWILWCIGEHYWYTRDVDWLLNNASQIVKGCDWIVNERKRTIEQAGKTPIRAIEKGLLPPGRLEDIGDWRCWMSTNLYSWWGMNNAAAALLDINHPDGQRLLDEAEKYRRDILTAFNEAMLRSPVVRLRDGRWIPHVPSDAHRRGRSFGWITETLEGAIHLIRTEAIDSTSMLASWIIQDFEDNLYLSKQYGYDLTEPDFERFWFSLGGISMQANLLHNPIPYLLRDEPKHYIRAYFNAFAVSYFPDTRMMTEHALPNIGDWRGDHFKSSDESNSTYWLRQMFVEEKGDELWYGAAIPRYWLEKGQVIRIQNAVTYFGVTSMEMQSSGNSITMTIDLPQRNPAQTVRARFRHPEGKPIQQCFLNGEEYTDFDPALEWVTFTPTTDKVEIEVYY